MDLPARVTVPCARVDHAAGQPAAALEAFRKSAARGSVVRFIDGRAEVKAHGPRDMPVCCARFYAKTHNERAVRARIAKLVAYLQSIQTGARHAQK